uniref:Allograft inflammatory factor 1 n=2 Tax=Sus scrofa TaxID=9823 RepID=A0A8D0QV49_PIG
MSVALSNRFQGGKAFGLLKARQERRLAEINREFLCDQKYSDEENLPEKLAAFKDLMSLKRMMEKLGVPKTHLEMKKMISEVTGGGSDTISYRDFVNMMLGKRSAVLKLVMMFEGKANESSPKPVGPLQRETLPACPEDAPPGPAPPSPLLFLPSDLAALLGSFRCVLCVVFGRCAFVGLFFHQQNQ